MSTVTSQQALADLTAAVTAEQAADAAAVAALQALTAQIATLTAGTITPAQIESLVALSNTATQSLAAATSAAVPPTS